MGVKMGKTIGFIGAGNMGGAICGALVGSGLFAGADIFVYDKAANKAEELASARGVKCADMKTAAGADFVLLAVKPNVLYGVIDDIKSFVGKDAVVISIAAGQSVAQIETAFSREIKLMRVMPNTPALVGEGMSALCPNKTLAANADEVGEVVKIFESLGKAEIVGENLMDAVTGVSGSSPAYVFMFIEALADSAVKCGLPRKDAYEFVAQTVLGSAKLMLETGKHPGELKDMVCSPGGTTIAGVAELEKNGFRKAIFEATDVCFNKCNNIK